MTLDLTEARNFDPAKHPRNHGRFATVRGAAAIANAPDHVRYGGIPSLSGRMSAPVAPMRSPTRGEAWQKIGSKINAIPVHYTGEKSLSRPVGSYLHLTIANQIPKTLTVQDHQKNVAKFIQTVKDKRKEILEGAEKARPGKKHIYLKPHEPASGGRTHWRMKPDLYPEGTPASTLHRAYNHAALLAMHDHGLVDYDFKMDDALKDELKPTEPFIRYARQRLFQEGAKALPGVRRQQLEHFGTARMKRKNGKETGQISHRFRPNQQLIKATPIEVKLARVHARRTGGIEPPLWTTPLRAAGLMLIGGSKQNPKVLLLKRADGGPKAGTWCFPGGKIEPGETPREAAIRETQEEAGSFDYTKPVNWTRRIADGVDFTTFLARVHGEPEPTLNEEHTDWEWADIDGLPSPMHPGCDVAITKIKAALHHPGLAKASPLSAASRIAGRAGAALDSVAVSHEAKQQAYTSAGNMANRLRGLFGAKEPNVANRGGYVAGRWAGKQTRSLFKQPVKTIKGAIKEGARTGSGFAEGVADEFGAKPGTRKIASRAGALVGALKVPVIAGAVAAKPVMEIAHMGRAAQQQGGAPKKGGML